MSGQVAVSFHRDGIRAMLAERMPSAPPRILAAAFYPCAEGERVTQLEKLGKDMQATLRQWTTVLAANEYQLLSLDAPNVPQEELKAAIRWRLKDMLDYHVDDATIDVLDVPPDKGAPARNHAMYAVAARNRLIEQRQALFADARIPLHAIDIPEMAQRNIAALQETAGRGLAMLSIGDEGSLLTVTFGGELYLSRRMDVHAEQLASGDEERQRQCHERITLELQRSLDFVDRQYQFIAISRLVLAPLARGGEALREHLAANLYIGVDHMDLSTSLDLSALPELKSAGQQQAYFMTLGAALRFEEKAL